MKRYFGCCVRFMFTSDCSYRVIFFIREFQYNLYYNIFHVHTYLQHSNSTGEY